MWLLDTSFLIALEDELVACRAGPARSFLAANRAEQPALSMVALGEFAEGYADYRVVEAFISRFRVVHLSRLIAYRMAAMQAVLPQRLGENDAWIAATALYYGVRLVGREAAFKRVPGLKYVEF